MKRNLKATLTSFGMALFMTASIASTTVSAAVPASTKVKFENLDNDTKCTLGPTISRRTVTMCPKETLKLKAMTENGKTPTWVTSNPKIAKVSKSGVVTAIAPGTTTITADFGKYGKVGCKITVKKRTAKAC